MFLQVVGYLKKILSDDSLPNPLPPHINMDGTVGTGKLFLICAITHALREPFGVEDIDPVVYLA